MAINSTANAWTSAEQAFLLKKLATIYIMIACSVIIHVRLAHSEKGKTNVAHVKQASNGTLAHFSRKELKWEFIVGHIALLLDFLKRH
jgi:putative copper export protein